MECCHQAIGVEYVRATLRLFSEDNFLSASLNKWKVDEVSEIERMDVSCTLLSLLTRSSWRRRYSLYDFDVEDKDKTWNTLGHKQGEAANDKDSSWVINDGSST